MDLLWSQNPKVAETSPGEQTVGHSAFVGPAPTVDAERRYSMFGLLIGQLQILMRLNSVNVHSRRGADGSTKRNTEQTAVHLALTAAK